MATDPLLNMKAMQERAFARGIQGVLQQNSGISGGEDTRERDFSGINPNALVNPPTTTQPPAPQPAPQKVPSPSLIQGLPPKVQPPPPSQVPQGTPQALSQSNDGYFGAGGDVIGSVFGAIWDKMQHKAPPNPAIFSNSNTEAANNSEYYRGQLEGLDPQRTVPPATKELIFNKETMPLFKELMGTLAGQGGQSGQTPANSPEAQMWIARQEEMQRLADQGGLPSGTTGVATDAITPQVSTPPTTTSTDTTGTTGTTGAGAVGQGGLLDMISSLYDNLRGEAQDQFGGLQTNDLTGKINEAMAGGRADLTALEAQQQADLTASHDRQVGNISQIESDLMAKLTAQEANRSDIQGTLAASTADRAAGLTQGASDRAAAARQGLGPAVTSEFEEVANLTAGLAASQAASSTEGMARLQQVANTAAAQRLSAPAELAAQAQTAVGDEKFRLENELRTQLAQGMAQLNQQEREMVLQEAGRQEEFGLSRDQALANAMFQIGQQQTGATLQEGQRLESVKIRQQEQAAAAAAAASRAKADQAWRQQQFDEGQRQFDINAQLSATGLAEDARQFDLANQPDAPDPYALDPASPLGQLNTAYPKVDDGLKSIAINIQSYDEDKRQQYIDSLGSTSYQGGPAMSTADRAIIEAMLGKLDAFRPAFRPPTPYEFPLYGDPTRPARTS